MQISLNNCFGNSLKRFYGWMVLKSPHDCIRRMQVFNFKFTRSTSFTQPLQLIFHLNGIQNNKVNSMLRKSLSLWLTWKCQRNRDSVLLFIFYAQDLHQRQQRTPQWLLLSFVLVWALKLVLLKERHKRNILKRRLWAKIVKSIKTRLPQIAAPQLALRSSVIN